MTTQSKWLYAGEAVELENQTIRVSVKILFLGATESAAKTQWWRVLEEKKLIPEWGNVSQVDFDVESLGLRDETLREARTSGKGIEILPIIEI